MASASHPCFRSHRWPLLAMLALALLLAACTTPSPQPTPSLLEPTPAVQESPTAIPSPTPTQLPSPTPEPLAALVNNEPITLAAFQAELARFQAARQALPDAPAPTGINLATEADVKNYVLTELVNQRLFAQAATASGFSLSQEALQTRLDALTAQVGGAQALDEWLAANQYDQTTFQAALARSIAVAWMRDQIAAGLPEAVEQIHARQILLYNLDQANQVLAQINSGQEFTSLAYQYDPAAGGDLGWFPRGYLSEPALEDAAFQLQPGSHSGVVQTRLGYHILLVIERQADRPLDPDARLALQEQALSTWLDTQRAQSNIQIFVP